MESSFYSVIRYSGSYTIAQSILDGIRGLQNVLVTWNHRIKERRQLAQLDDYLLKDVGLEAWQVRQQIEKPFWRA